MNIKNFKKLPKYFETIGESEPKNNFKVQIKYT